MDPSERKKRNSEAPYHVIGKVTSDELFKDLTKEKGAPYQLRKMTIELEEVLKKPSSTNVDVLAIDVYYSYIPSWRALDYIGGHQPMDITVNDVIEIWLREGEYGWNLSSLEIPSTILSMLRIVRSQFQNHYCILSYDSLSWVLNTMAMELSLLEFFYQLSLFFILD